MAQCMCQPYMRLVYLASARMQHYPTLSMWKEVSLSASAYYVTTQSFIMFKCLNIGHFDCQVLN